MEDDLPASKSLIEKHNVENEEAVINRGCILYKEKLFQQAIEQFQRAVQLVGSKSHLSFNIALCYYELREYALSLKYIADIIERGIKEHPELSVGLTTEGIDVRSVGNTKVLHETALIEAFNLKSAIEYQLGNMDAAAEGIDFKVFQELERIKKYSTLKLLSIRVFAVTKILNTSIQPLLICLHDKKTNLTQLHYIIQP